MSIWLRLNSSQMGSSTLKIWEKWHKQHYKKLKFKYLKELLISSKVLLEISLFNSDKQTLRHYLDSKTSLLPIAPVLIYLIEQSVYLVEIKGRSRPHYLVVRFNHSIKQTGYLLQALVIKQPHSVLKFLVSLFLDRVRTNLLLSKHLLVCR